ncbi:hypothetical protein GCM10007907_11960 [Chitinimonas prasina]|uniref:Enoyl reductase (ER) domain-containing protein n=1 Tax=Chitinimonas prasina TaxID=1434937 RepID=A0ABQ5YGJ9_9NEIS|nr:zinc-binding alcohol dehydrogenase family protein [Chitinimonas prasina]GLR12406.1 hypothetical protein GCM10007907_11960 [Chitinimonas prasina]
MKSFVVLAPQTAASLAPALRQRATLHGTQVDFALVEQRDADFDAQDPKHAHSVLVQVRAFSCNYREKARFLDIAQKPAGKGYLVLGSEFAGTVLKTGPAVHHLRVGDRVCGNGSVEPGQDQPGLTTQRASSERQVHHQDKLFRLPDSMSLVEGAAFSIGAQTAYSMVRRLPAEGMQHVAITAAASNTSLFAIRALLARGCQVHALTTSASLEPHLRKLGVQHCCVLGRDGSYPHLLQNHLANLGLSGFDAVLDPFSDIYLRKLLPFVRRFGSYVTCGVYQQFAEQQPDAFVHEGLTVAEVFSLLIRKSISLVGNNLGTTADLEQAVADYAAGRLHINLDTVVTDGDLGRFIERSYLAPDRLGKVVFDYGEPAATPRPAQQEAALA